MFWYRDLELKEVNQKAKEMKDFLDQVKTVSDDVQSMTENQFYTLEELDQKLIEVSKSFALSLGSSLSV